LKTSYFAKAGTHPNAISIAAYNPSWFKGRSYPDLAPPWTLVSMYKKGYISKDDYELKYIKILEELDPQKVIKDLGENAVLLCYEKPSEFCHRHIVAQWLSDRTGITITELE